MEFDRDRAGLYLWMQGIELEEELKKYYKKIHRIGVFGNTFCIWFLNNEDSIGIPLDIMCSIYDKNDKESSVERLVRVIDKEYLARIKVSEEKC